MDKHAENKRQWELDLAACGGNVAEAAKWWEWRSPYGAWLPFRDDSWPAWLTPLDYRRRADAPTLKVEPVAQPEFARDWPHGWQTRDGGEAGIYETFKDTDGKTLHHGWFIGGDGRRRFETWYENGRCFSEGPMTPALEAVLAQIPQRPELQGIGASYELAFLDARCSYLEAQRDAAVLALLEFGHHTNACRFRSSFHNPGAAEFHGIVAGSCTCGLETAAKRCSDE